MYQWICIYYLKGMVTLTQLQPPYMIHLYPPINNIIFMSYMYIQFADVFPVDIRSSRLRRVIASTNLFTPYNEIRIMK